MANSCRRACGDLFLKTFLVRKLTLVSHSIRNSNFILTGLQSDPYNFRMCKLNRNGCIYSIWHKFLAIKISHMSEEDSSFLGPSFHAKWTPLFSNLCILEQFFTLTCHVSYPVCGAKLASKVSLRPLAIWSCIAHSMPTTLSVFHFSVKVMPAKY